MVEVDVGWAKRIAAKVRSVLRKQNTETRLSAATKQQQRAHHKIYPFHLPLDNNKPTYTS